MTADTTLLTQEEADSLYVSLLGIDAESDGSEKESSDGVRPYEIGRQERIVRGRMPTLEIVNDRFSRGLRVGLFGFMRKSCDITVSPVKVQKYSDFVRNLVVPTNINIVSLAPLRGNSLFVFDPSLIDTVVDAMFGGKNQFKAKSEGREFTPTEQRIISLMLEIVFGEYKKSWSSIHKIQPDYVRSEMYTQFANVANPSEIVVSTSFSIEIGSSGGMFHICIPYSTLEPIRDILYSSMQGDQVEPDKRWSNSLKGQIRNTRVELVAELAATELSVKDVANLQVGDIVYMDLNPIIEAQVEGLPLFSASYGKSKRTGKYCLSVEEVYKENMDELN